MSPGPVSPEFRAVPDLLQLVAHCRTVAVSVLPDLGVLRVYVEQHPSPSEWAAVCQLVRQVCTGESREWYDRDIDVIDYRIAPGVELPAS